MLAVRRALRVPTVARFGRVMGAWNEPFATGAMVAGSQRVVARRMMNTAPPPPQTPPGRVRVVFIDPQGLRTPVEAADGESILEAAHANGVDLEGACEGSLACSTCHVILPESYYRKLEEPGDEENDMLDMAFGLTETSRLGCQVRLTSQLEGMEIRLPSATRNMAVDGFVPKPH